MINENTLLTIEEKQCILSDIIQEVMREGLITFNIDYWYLMIEQDTVFIEIMDKGYIIYMIAEDFTGIKTLSELFLYIPKDKRGGRLFISMIHRLEELAKENGCKQLRIADNYNNEGKLSRYLLRKGYKTDSVYKEV